MAQVTPVYSPEVSPASKGWLEEHSCSSVLTGVDMVVVCPT